LTFSLLNYLGCDEPCTDEYDPYCASNGRTYGNICMFRIARCKSGNTLIIKSRGKCHWPKITNTFEMYSLV